MEEADKKAKEIKEKKEDAASRLERLEDLLNLNQLDLINLKNELEKIRLSTTSSIPPEIEQRIVDMEKLASKTDVMKKWAKTVDEVKFLRSKIMGAPVPEDMKTAEERDMERIRGEIADMRRELDETKSGAIKQPDIDVAGLKNAVSENRKTIEDMKTALQNRPGQEATASLESVMDTVRENRRTVENLRSRMSETGQGMPEEARKEIEKLHSEIGNLEREFGEMKSREPAEEEPSDEIGALKRELHTKLDELNRKFSSEGTPEEIRQALDANRKSIKRLKGLVKREGLEEIKEELDENRKFMEEIKRVLLVKKPGAKVVLKAGEDNNTRKKLEGVEKKVRALSRKLEKMSNLKPVKLPKIEKSKHVKKAGESELDELKERVENVISKMDDFVTKEDAEKKLLAKTVETDKKLVKDEIYKEMEDVKKAVLRNEDHIENVVSDVESLKKEVGTVEEREWGKVSEMPEMEKLKGRIESLEKKVEQTSKSPVFIE